MNYPDLKQSFLQAGNLLISLCLPCRYQPDWADGHHDFLCFFFCWVYARHWRMRFSRQFWKAKQNTRSLKKCMNVEYFSMPCYKCYSEPVSYTMVSCFTRLSGHWSASETGLFRMVFDLLQWCDPSYPWKEQRLPNEFDNGQMSTGAEIPLVLGNILGGKFSFDVYWYWRLDCRTWWLCSAEVCVCIPLPAFSLGMEANKTLGRKHLRNER